MTTMLKRLTFIQVLLAYSFLHGQNVGIGTTTPTERLHIQGNLRLDGAFMPGNTPGASGQVLVSEGPNVPPVWRPNSPGILTWHIDSWNPGSTSNLGWNCVGCGGSSPWLTSCGTNLTMLGGYGICGSGCYFEKTFTGLPPHSEVYVEVAYYAIDSWDHNNCCGHDYLEIRLDGVAQARCYPAASNGEEGAQRLTNASVCGSSAWQDIGALECTAYTSHTANTLTVRIVSGLNQASTDESLGIVSVAIYIK